MLRILGPRVLVALPPVATEVDAETGYTFQPRSSAGSIILAAQPDAYDREAATRGVVVQLGEPDRRIDLDAAIDAVESVELQTDVLPALKRLGPAPFDVAVGDCVIFPAHAGETLHQDGLDYLIVNEADIVGVLAPIGKERDWLQRLQDAVTTAQRRGEEVCA